MVNALNGLRHDTVIGGDNENGNIGYHCTASSHRCKCLMTRSVKECYGTAVNLNSICADMLGYAACLAGCNVCMTDIVKKRGLAVVNVTHNNYDRRTADEFFFAVFVVVYEFFFHGYNNFFFNLAAELHSYESCGIIVDDIGYGCKNAKLNKALDDFSRRLFHSRCRALPDGALQTRPAPAGAALPC